MASWSVRIPASTKAWTRSLTCPAVPTPMVSPRLSSLAPRSKRRLPTDDHLVDRHRPLPRVAEAHAHVGPDVEPGLAGPGHRGLEHRELLVEAAVEVLAGEGLGGAAEDGDVPHPELEGPVEAALVGHQHGVGAALLAEHRHQLGGVGQLGHPPRVDEAGRLDDGQAGGDQAAYELGLVLGRDDRLLVLQAVAGADLVDRDLLGQGFRDGAGRFLNQRDAGAFLNHRDAPRRRGGRRRAGPAGRRRR